MICTDVGPYAANFRRPIKWKVDMNRHQKIGMAGELIVAVQLFRRNLDVSLTLTNTKAIDLFAFNAANKRTYPVQVKTLKSPNCFPIKFEAICADHVYIFVLLKGMDEREEYFIVPGHVIKANRDKYFGSSYHHAKVTVPAINIGPLRRERSEAWQVFEA